MLGDTNDVSDQCQMSDFMVSGDCEPCLVTPMTCLRPLCQLSQWCPETEEYVR